VGRLAELCRDSGVPCIVFAGEISASAQALELFNAAYALSPEFASRKHALAEPTAWLEKAAEAAAKRPGA